MSVSETDRSFQTPTLVQNPMVTVSNTGPEQIPLVTLVFPPKHLDPAHIKLRVKSVYAKEMSIKPITQPIPQFRLYQPMFKLFIPRPVPRVVISRDIHREFSRQGKFHPQIRSHRCPVKRIRLDCQHGHIRNFMLLLSHDTHHRQKHYIQ